MSILHTVIKVETIESTNRLAKDLVEKGAEDGTVVWALQQSLGRGQYERGFFSPPGGIYFSLITVPTLLRGQDTPLITLAAGLGCHDTLSQTALSPVRLKWPNDLYCRQKKMGGILSEFYVPQHSTASIAEAVIVGVGINVNNRSADFPEELQNLVCSLSECSNSRQYVLSHLLDSLVCNIQKRIAQLVYNRTSLFSEWQNVDYLFGKKVQYSFKGSIRYSGYGRGINELGCYLVLDEFGELQPIIGGQLRLSEGNI